MIKKPLSALLCAAVLTAFLSSCSLPGKQVQETPEKSLSSAASVTDAPKKMFENLTYEIEGGRAVITGCAGNATDTLRIPDKIEDCPVTGISDFAFRDKTALTGVSIPDTVTAIGEGAFYGCTGIRRIDIPDTVISIGHNAFYNTAYYNFKTSWDGKVFYAGNHLIYAKRSIEGDYAVREGTVSIADNAFSDTEDGYCTELKSISIPSSVRFIGKSAFEYCEGLTEINIPDGVIGIGSAAFRECTGLKDITLPDSIRSIGENAFVYTAYSNNPGNWTDGVMYIGNHLIKAEDSVSGSFTVKAGTVSIADCAFSYCAGLREIIIPETVTAAGENIFTGCDNLRDVYYEGIQGEGNAVSGLNLPAGAVIHYGYGKEQPASGEEPEQPASPDAGTGTDVSALSARILFTFIR